MSRDPAFEKAARQIARQYAHEDRWPEIVGSYPVAKLALQLVFRREFALAIAKVRKWVQS